MFHLHRVTSISIASCLLLNFTACGTVVPQVGEFWEGRDVDNKIAYTIKKKIFCELVKAIDEVNAEIAIQFPNAPLNAVIPDDYGVQMQTTLTIEENSALNPTITYNYTLRNGSAAGLSIGQMYNIGFGGTASATATRTDTNFSYWLVGKVAHGKNDPYCNDTNDKTNPNGSSPLIQSNLGIKDFLFSNAKGAYLLHSSAPGKSKSSKLDIYTYEIKFAVVSNGNINPTWKLVAVSGGGGLPLLQAGRMRTHDLILTFGPNAEKGFEPSQTALNQHLAAQLKSSFEVLRTPLIP